MENETQEVIDHDIVLFVESSSLEMAGFTGTVLIKLTTVICLYEDHIRHLPV